MNLSVVIISLIPPLITKVCSVKTTENRLVVPFGSYVRNQISNDRDLLGGRLKGTPRNESP